MLLEEYCIETWNVRSMNQGKLEVVKHETARMNVDILGITELKWTGMGELNSTIQLNMFVLRKENTGVLSEKSGKTRISHGRLRK